VAVVTKPFTERQLLEAVARLLPKIDNAAHVDC
jgi:hypothetical protein